MVRKILIGILLVAASLTGCSRLASNTTATELPANYSVFVINQGGGFRYRDNVNDAYLIDDHTAHIITTTGGEFDITGYYIEIVPIK